MNSSGDHLHIETMYGSSQIGSGRAKTQLPLSKIAQWLMMDSEDEAVQLCVHHGLALVSDAEGRPQLSLRANSFITPDETLPRRRSEVGSSPCPTRAVMSNLPSLTIRLETGAPQFFWLSFKA
jgi:hypothetical protein